MVTMTMRRWRVLEPAIMDIDTDARAGLSIERAAKVSNVPATYEASALCSDLRCGCTIRSRMFPDFLQMLCTRVRYCCLSLRV
jgi:hypothetical protein